MYLTSLHSFLLFIKVYNVFWDGNFCCDIKKSVSLPILEIVTDIIPFHDRKYNSHFCCAMKFFVVTISFYYVFMRRQFLIFLMHSYISMQLWMWSNIYFLWYLLFNKKYNFLYCSIVLLNHYIMSFILADCS